MEDLEYVGVLDKDPKDSKIDDLNSNVKVMFWALLISMILNGVMLQIII